MLLSKLITSMDVLKTDNFKDIELTSIEYDSKDVKKGVVFFANKGRNYVENNFSGDDGHYYIKEAVEKGASACVIDLECSNNLTENFKYKEAYLYLLKNKVSTIVVQDTVKEISKAAALFYDYPSKKMNVIGITGTNGKTSTAFIIEYILKYAGYKPGVIGSVSYRYNDKIIDQIEYTTPKALYYQKMMKTMFDEGVTHFVTEVSSHGIDFDRVNNIDFDVAIFTNLTRDHLEYHQTMENYFNTKKKLFTNLLIDSTKSRKFALINLDCAYGQRLYEILKFNSDIHSITYGFTKEANTFVSEYKLNGNTSSFIVKISGLEYEFKIPLVGKHNIYNTLVGITVANSVYGIDIKLISELLSKFKPIEGRLEPVVENYNIFVDYAHTDDALSNVLSSLRSAFPNKKIKTVFGCGGNRDKGKRPKMGRVATDLSDYTYITSDNPRFEDPKKIIESISAGVKKGLYEVIIDRKKAIEKAILEMSKEGDVLLIAGKGHEHYQEVKGERYHFDDKEVVKEIIKSFF